jgi:hypothetical protein
MRNAYCFSVLSSEYVSAAAAEDITTPIAIEPYNIFKQNYLCCCFYYGE